MAPQSIEIAGRKVGPGHPCLIIAEAGVNHNGDLDLARRLIDVAVDAGADVVKFQTAVPEKVVSTSAPKATYSLETTDPGESQLDMVRRLHPFTPEDFAGLIEHCHERGIMFMSSPFDEPSTDLLDSLGVAAFKVPSGEITNLPYLSRMAAKGKPMVVSTGMSYLSEVETAVRTMRETGNEHLVLLQCVSNYPADPAAANLRSMHTMSVALGALVGYSDHTHGIEVSLAAVALGACVIEKHFTMDRELPGPDHRASLEPEELGALVIGIRSVESALGNGRKEPAVSEANTADVARKSLVAAVDIKAGTVLTEEMIEIKRPGTGLAPAMRPSLVGRSASVDIPEDALLTMEMLS